MILNKNTAIMLAVLFSVLVLVRIVYTIWRRKAVASAPAGGKSPLDDKSLIKSTIDMVDAFLVAIVLVFMIIKPFVVQTFFIPSESMLPTLQIQDRLLVNKFVYWLKPPQRGDIIVFAAPPEALGPGDQEKKDFIKRIIGLPGDHIQVVGRRYVNQNEIVGGIVYVNGKSLDEPYVTPENLPDYDFDTEYVVPGGVVPEGKLLVLGDNRDDSNDGHVWGLLDQKRIIGKALCIFWPLNRMRLL